MTRRRTRGVFQRIRLRRNQRLVDFPFHPRSVRITVRARRTVTLGARGKKILDILPGTLVWDNPPRRIYIYGPAIIEGWR